MIESKIVLIEGQGPWPTNAVGDIIKAREELIKLGHEALVITQFLGYYTPVNIHISTKTYEDLNQLIPDTLVSYKRFFETNGVASFVEDDSIEDAVALISFENDTIQINGIIPQSSNQTTKTEGK